VEKRKIHNEEINDLYSPQYIIREIKSRRIRWAGHVALIREEVRWYSFLVWKGERKGHL
jgi:hypothetical protein